MRHLSDILASKRSRALHTIAPTASVCEAMELMAQRRISALVVMEAGDLVDEIVADRRLLSLEQVAHPLQSSA